MSFFPVFVVNVSINGFGDIRYDSGICFRVFRRIFDEDGDGIAGAVRQDDESRIVGPGEDASFVAVARAGFVSDDGAGSRQWFRKTVGTCFTVYQVLPDHFPQCRSENLFCYEQLQQSGRFAEGLGAGKLLHERVGLLEAQLLPEGAGWLSWDSGLRVMAQVAIWGIRSFTRRRVPYSKEVSTAFSSSPASGRAMTRSTISSSRSK